MKIYSLTLNKRLSAKMSIVILINQCTQLLHQHSWNTTTKNILIVHDVSSTNNSSSHCHVNIEVLAHQYVYWKCWSNSKNITSFSLQEQFSRLIQICKNTEVHQDFQNSFISQMSQVLFTLVKTELSCHCQY